MHILMYIYIIHAGLVYETLLFMGQFMFPISMHNERTVANNSSLYLVR